MVFRTIRRFLNGRHAGDLLRRAALVSVGMLAALQAAGEGGAITREAATAALQNNREQLAAFTAVIDSRSQGVNGDIRFATTTITVVGDSRHVETFSGARRDQWTHRRVAAWNDGALVSVHGDPRLESRVERTTTTRWRAVDLHVVAEPLTALCLHDPEPGAAGSADLVSLLAEAGYPFGERVNVDGHPAVLLDLLGRRHYFLDAERGFAVLRIDSFNRDGGLQSRVENSNFVEVSDGLWVPHRVMQTRYAEGAAIGETTEHLMVAFKLAPELDGGAFDVPDVISTEAIAVHAPESLSPQPQVNPLSIGQPAPAINARAVDGRPVKLEDYQGKVVLIQFWATWCRPCIAAKPTIIAAYQRYRFQGFEVISVSLDQDWPKLRNYLNNNPSESWPTLYDGRGWENEIGQQYQVRSIPLTLLLDAEGTIRYRNAHRGNFHESIETLLAELPE